MHECLLSRFSRVRLFGPHGLRSSVHGILQVRTPEWVAILYKMEYWKDIKNYVS